MPKWRRRSWRNRRCSFHILPSVLIIPDDSIINVNIFFKKKEKDKWKFKKKTNNYRIHREVSWNRCLAGRRILLFWKLHEWFCDRWVRRWVPIRVSHWIRFRISRWALSILRENLFWYVANNRRSDSHKVPVVNCVTISTISTNKRRSMPWKWRITSSKVIRCTTCQQSNEASRWPIVLNSTQSFSSSSFSSFKCFYRNGKWEIVFLSWLVISYTLETISIRIKYQPKCGVRIKIFKI